VVFEELSFGCNSTFSTPGMSSIFVIDLYVHRRERKRGRYMRI
jgi:hypothetical protein